MGYSDNPTANIPDDEHGFVVGYPYFGESGHESYGMGKTAVHEIGHYLNLKHLHWLCFFLYIEKCS